MSEIQIFKTISIGNYTKSEILNSLERADVHFNDYAKTLFDYDEYFKSEEVNLKIVKVKLPDLGLDVESTYKDIVKAAKERGLSLCPHITAAYLRLEFLDQESGPYITVASSWFDNGVDTPRGSYLRFMDGKLWLRGYYASEDYLWPIESEFFFCIKDN